MHTILLSTHHLAVVACCTYATPAGNVLAGVPQNKPQHHYGHDACRLQSQSRDGLGTAAVVGIVLGAIMGGVVLLGVAVVLATTWARNKRLQQLQDKHRSFQKFDDASMQA